MKPSRRMRGPEKRKFWGKYMAICRDIHDPEKLGRIRVECPAVYGKGHLSDWAWPCFRPGEFLLPKEGDGVWIEFQAGDPAYPVWTGVWYTRPDGPNGAPWQEDHDELMDKEGNSVDRDAADHAEDKEHLRHHGHPPYYDPHLKGWLFPSGHRIRVEESPGGQYLELVDPHGRVVRITDEAGVEGIELRDAAGQYIRMHDDNHPEPDEDWYIEVRDKAGNYVRLDSTTDKEFIEVRDKAGNYVRLDSTTDTEFIEVKDKAGNKIRLDATNGAEFVEMQDLAGNKIRLDPVEESMTWTDQHGNIMKTSVDGLFMDIKKDLVMNIAENWNVTVGQNVLHDAGGDTIHKTAGNMTAEAGGNHDTVAGGIIDHR